MEPVRKIAHPRTSGPVDLQLILNPTVNVKVKLQFMQKISDSLEECCRTQLYFDNLIFVFIKLLSITEPSFSPDNDVFKLRKLILQIIHKICSSNDKMKNHIQNIMGICLKIIEVDNEQCVIYCILIFKELLTAFKPKFDGSFKTEVIQFLKLILEFYNNSSTREKILNFQNPTDVNVKINTIRLTTTITKNSTNLIVIPMGKVSFKVLKELAHILKLYYILFFNVQSFRKEIIEFFPTLVNFFNLDIPYKPDYRDLVIDMKHAQVRLLFFFSIFLKDNKDVIRLYCSTLPGRIISLLNCNMSSDVSSLRTELLSGFESVILIDYKCEFLPHMDKFLDETLITGRSWSLKHVLRPKAYVYIDHLITHLHNQLSLNFLVRVIHSHFSNILDPTLQPEVQINLCNMVMNVLNYVIQRQNQLITNINTIEPNKDPIIDLLYRIFQIFVIKLKQFQKFYLLQFDESSIYEENVEETISSILLENQFKKNQEFMYGYHSSQIPSYTIADCKRFVKMIIPSIRTLFQFIVKFEGGVCLMDHYYNKSLKHFIKYSLLSLKVYSSPIQKEEMIKEILNTLSCVNMINLKISINGDILVKLIYKNSLESLVINMALDDEVLVTIFSCVMLEYILNNMTSENERECINDMINRLQFNFKLNSSEEIADEYVYKIIEKATYNLKDTTYFMFYLRIIKSMVIIVESSSYEFGENMNSILLCLLKDLLLYFQSLPNGMTLTKVMFASICLTDCLFKVIHHSQVMNLMNIIAYSLQIAELTPQAINILEKCIDIMPNNNYNKSDMDIINEIMRGLYHCLNNPLEPISKSAIRILGRFGGLNRSSIIKPYYLNDKKQFQQSIKTPQIFISFEKQIEQLLKIDISLGVNTAIETLNTNNDRFYRANCWNIIRGYLIVSMQYDHIDIIKELIHCTNWKSSILILSDSELQNVKFNDIINDTYKKALIGLMTCCNDEYLKNDAIKYLNKCISHIVQISICYFSGLITNNHLKFNPYVLIDAIIISLSNEKMGISDIGKFATNAVIRNLCNVLGGESMIHFPFIAYMLRQCCDLCYVINWIHKRGGCIGLKILFSIYLSQKITIKQFSNWFIQHFPTVFKATLYIFSDFNEHLTFGTLEIARSNMFNMLNWFYQIKRTHLSHDLLLDSIEESMLKDLIDFIIGPNDLLRDESIHMVNLIAQIQQKKVLDILKPYIDYIKLKIPGKQLFNTYTFKTQIGIMKGHIYCALFSIPLETFDLSNARQRDYFNTLFMVFQINDEEFTDIFMFNSLTSYELLEFRQLAMQVLVNCLSCFTQNIQNQILNIIWKKLQSPNKKLQETAYLCLINSNAKLFIETTMVDKLFLYYTDHFQNNSQITLENIRIVLYLSKLFPSCQNKFHCNILLNVFKQIWNDLHRCKNNKSKYELELILKNILEIIYLITEIQFFHIKEICEIILNEDILNIELCSPLYPMFMKCLMKFPEDCVLLFFQEIHIKNTIWSSFFNSIIRNEEGKSVRNILTSDPLYIENLLTSSKIEQSRTIQYESIRIIFNLLKMNEEWIISKKIVGILLNIWSNPQYKERYKNLAAIKSNEWNEPKMLLKIVLTYFKNNTDEIYILFQILPAFSSRFPVDIYFLREFLEKEIIKTYSVEWKRMVFFKFIDLYQKKGVNGDILGKILQYLILPCFSICYKNGDKEKLLRTHAKPEESIIAIVLNKIFTNIRVALVGCDFDGIKVFICQLICLLIEDLLNFNENICDLLYNAVISCTWIKCTMDINVKFHCYLILTYIMLSGNASKREKLNQGIYYELLKASFAEAQPVINYSLNLIVSAVCEKNKEVNTLVVCIKKIMMTESQNVPTLHHICSFLIKYNILFYPYKQFLIRNILGSLFPIAKNNNVPEFKNTAIELACMIIQWELTDNVDNMKLQFPLKRKIDDIQSTTVSTSQYEKLKSSEIIDNCLNFLAMVGCQTHDDKPESRISKLAIRSAKLFKTILSTESIDTMEVKLKFGWIEKLLDTFLKKESLVKQNSNVLGNTNASLMNLLTTFDIVSFMLNVLSQKLMLEAIKPLQEHLIQFLQLAFNKIHNSSLHTANDILTNNRLTESQVNQYNDGTLKVVKEILNTFPSKEGIENLHTYVELIISEGLKSNCPYKSDISLSLLRVSLLHFPSYMDNEILNTIGDILFKFNENNSNPFVKVKCLEILSNHVETLTRIGKQVFIEKVVLENLNKARDSENNIPYEVQIKCFGLIISYIKELSEATEGIILNSTFLEYIKTTTDERIMITILNVINKWICICRDESVYFNCKVIKVLKTVTMLNRFPTLNSWCYRMNLEIFKNWKYQECIEYGINCTFPSIRYDFLKLYFSLWEKEPLHMRLYAIMSGKISYNLEFSLSFYIQLFLTQISKDTYLQGDFSLLNMQDLDEMFSITKKELKPVHTILTYDVISSLSQLCFINDHLAKNLWVSIIPWIWNFFSENHRSILSMKAVQFLENSKLKNNFMTIFYDAIILCKPNIYFEPHLMVHIGKTYNLWYKVIDQMEDVCSYYEHHKKNKSMEGLIQMYSLLREEDVLEYLYKQILKCEKTKEILSLEQNGEYEEAANKYIDILNCNIKTHMNNSSFDLDREFGWIHLTKCLKKLNDWDYISKNILTQQKENISLSIECKWKNSILQYNYCSNLKYELEQNQIYWPSKINWKYHFYMGMFNFKESNSRLMSIIQDHIKFAINEIINQWKILPKYICDGHLPFIQASQLIWELQEALYIKTNILLPPKSININVLINQWTGRKPWLGDDLNVWSDLISWRQTYYSSFENSNAVDYIKLAQVQSIVQLAEVSLKQNGLQLFKQLLNELNKLNLNNDSILIQFSKLYLESQYIKHKKKNININDHKSIFYSNNNFICDKNYLLSKIVKGSFQYYLGHTDIAFKYFTMGFYNQNIIKFRHKNMKWQFIVNYHFKKIMFDNNNKQLNSFLINNKVLENAWIQWATLIEYKFNQSAVKDIRIALAAMKCYIIALNLTSNKRNILLAKILWLLSYENSNYILLCTIEQSNIIFTDLWLSQILNIIVEKKEIGVNRIMSKIGQLHPQKMYLTLNRMYVAEKMNLNINKNDIQRDSSKIKKIKQMMNLMLRYNLDIMQLDYFVNQIVALGENWNEELRRKLYECLYQSYDYAYQKKYLNVQVPRKILNLIEIILISFDAQDIDKSQLSEYYQYFKDKFLNDFNSVSTIKMMINNLWKWIKYLEIKTIYPTRIVYELRCPTIYKFDWSMIQLPSEHYINIYSKIVRIHNFSSHVYLKDKSGIIVKEITIRGTDGLLYTYSISVGKNIESEERIFQLFYIENNYLLNYKKAAQRFLKFSIPKSLEITPNLRMVETNKSIVSLLEIYQRIIKTEWIHKDIDFWFSMFNSCITYDIYDPLKIAFLQTIKKFNTDKVIKNWVLLAYPLQSDYWTFRKTFIEHYSVLCFSEYAFNLTKLKPEMLHIDKDNGASVILYYTFNLSKQGNLVTNECLPFRITPSLQTFITTNRSCQMINCLTAINSCLYDNIDDISTILKLLLKDEFNANYKFTNNRKLLDKSQKIIKMVDKNIKSILKRIKRFRNKKTRNSISEHYNQASNTDILKYFSPIFRLWL